MDKIWEYLKKLLESDDKIITKIIVTTSIKWMDHKVKDQVNSTETYAYILTENNKGVRKVKILSHGQVKADNVAESSDVYYKVIVPWIEGNNWAVERYLEKHNEVIQISYITGLPSDYIPLSEPFEKLKYAGREFSFDGKILTDHERGTTKEFHLENLVYPMTRADK